MDNRIVFHFNKKHNEDPTVPMWVLKHRGKTHYVNHFKSHVGFSTKETPDNLHTKGSVLIRGELRLHPQEDGRLEAEVIPINIPG